MSSPAEEVATSLDDQGESGRTRLLDAAEQLFSEQGYDKASVRDIATRAGVSRGSIPWHFENKDGLLIAVIERLISRYMPATIQRPADVSMRDLTAEYRTMTEGRSPNLMFMMLTEALSSRGHVNEQYINLFRRRRKAIGGWVRHRAGKDAYTPADLKAMAAIINGALLAIQLQYLLDPEEINYERTLDVLADMVDGTLSARG